MPKTKERHAFLRPPKRRSSHILITAGPTREPLDPVRFISNPSTGMMGIEIARQARRRGHKVTLICGPTFLEHPGKIRFISVETARQMGEAVEKYFPKCNCLIMAAAVGDWRPSRTSSRKIKRSGSFGRKKKFRLELAQNPDILRRVSRKKGKRMVVGFALETDELIENARRKLLQKNLDFIVANRIKAGQEPFGKGKPDVVIISKDGTIARIKRSPKPKIAKILLDLIGL